jgi:hypothetical protein
MFAYAADVATGVTNAARLALFGWDVLLQGRLT